MLRRPRRKAPESRERLEGKARQVEGTFRRKRAEATRQLEEAIEPLHGERRPEAREDSRP